MGKRPHNINVRFWRDPDLPGVEIRYSSYNEESFRKHSHPCYSISIIETGRTTFQLDNEFHDARAGQIALIEPDRVHACNPDLESDMTYRMFYVDVDWVRRATDDGATADALPRFSSPVIDDRPLVDLWRKLFDTVTNGASMLEKETLLIRGLGDLFTRHGDWTGAQPESGDRTEIDRVKTHMAERVADKLSLDELAKSARMSRYHFLRVFQDIVGLPPHAYQNQLRVALGKRLLADGTPILEAALEAGFADQSHFSRVFKQFTGATPSQYMNHLSA